MLYFNLRYVFGFYLGPDASTRRAYIFKGNLNALIFRKTVLGTNVRSLGGNFFGFYRSLRSSI